MQFGGLAIMPFALLVLSEGGARAAVGGVRRDRAGVPAGGAGAHTTQTAGLALATDIVDEDKRPRVIALMYLMMLHGHADQRAGARTSAADFTSFKLIQVIQGTAVFTVVCNAFLAVEAGSARAGVVPVRQGRAASAVPRGVARRSWGGAGVRLLVASGLGFFAFNLQDVLLEPYGGEILGLHRRRNDRAHGHHGGRRRRRVRVAANVMRIDTILSCWPASGPWASSDSSLITASRSNVSLPVPGRRHDDRLRRGALRCGHPVVRHGAS
jgi:hypothetical protein